MKKILAIVSIFITATVSLFAYNGTWVSMNPSTGTINKLVITDRGAKAFVRTNRGTKNLGRASYLRLREGLMVAWEKPRGRGHIVALIKKGRANRLNVVTTNLYNDGRTPKIKTERFKKHRRAVPALRSSQLKGNWTNTNRNTHGVTRLKIRDRRGLVARAWGRCHPNDCDWGRAETTRISGNRLIAKWRNRRGGVKRMTITGQNYNRATGRYNRLKAHVNYQYGGRNGRRDWQETYTMRRGR